MTNLEKTIVKALKLLTTEDCSTRVCIEFTGNQNTPLLLFIFCYGGYGAEVFRKPSKEMELALDFTKERLFLIASPDAECFLQSFKAKAKPYELPGTEFKVTGLEFANLKFAKQRFNRVNLACGWRQYLQPRQLIAANKADGQLLTFTRDLVTRALQFDAGWPTNKIDLQITVDECISTIQVQLQPHPQQTGTWIVQAQDGELGKNRYTAVSKVGASEDEASDLIAKHMLRRYGHRIEKAQVSLCWQ